MVHAVKLLTGTRFLFVENGATAVIFEENAALGLGSVVEANVNLASVLIAISQRMVIQLVFLSMSLTRCWKRRQYVLNGRAIVDTCFIENTNRKSLLFFRNVICMIQKLIRVAINRAALMQCRRKCWMIIFECNVKLIGLSERYVSCEPYRELARQCGTYLMLCF